MRKYLPPLILFFLLLIGWQALALGINAAYILPTPIQVIQKLWELREPLFMVHLPGYHVRYLHRSWHLRRPGSGIGHRHGHA